MTLKRVSLTFLVVAALVAGAYTAGYWPEHRKLAAAEEQGRALQTRLEAAEARNRIAELLGQALRLSDAVAAQNFGEAATLATQYFDTIRQEGTRGDQREVAETLSRLLQGRDQVTTALARAEPAVAIALKEQEVTLRTALGYAVVPATTARPGQ